MRQRKIGLNLAHLRHRQPKQIAHQQRLLAPPMNQSFLLAASNLMGPEPRSSVERKCALHAYYQWAKLLVSPTGHCEFRSDARTYGRHRLRGSTPPEEGAGGQPDLPLLPLSQERAPVLITLVDLLFVCIVLAAFAFGLRAGVGTLVVIRPLTDRLFELGSFDVAGQSVTYGVVVNIVVISAMILNISKIRQCTPSGLVTAWLPFLLVCAIAVLYSPLQIDALRRLSVYVCYYSIFMLSFVIVKSERDVLFFLKLVILSSVLPVLYGLFQILSGFGWFDDFRIQSTFSHPNMFAFYLLAVIGVILFLFATERVRISGRLRLVLNLYVIPLLIVLVMTKTRSAWIGCLVLFLVYGVTHDRRVLVVLLIATPLAFAIPAVSDRIMDLTSENSYIGGPAVLLNSYAWRELLWNNAFTYIVRHPIFGYGLHSFPFYSREFFSPVPGGTYAHNDYIQILFETGLAGLLAFLWIYLRCFIWLVQRWRFDKGGGTAAAAIMATYLICSYSDNLLEYLPYQWEFWFPFGVICWHMARCPAQAGSRQRRFASWSSLKRTQGLHAADTATRDAAGPQNLGH